ncbi:MAG: hypothetical protein OEY49_06265 [Candidatus Heimdallarchaeota archaeon]|nr:hypothetical protein [Candidatus Heimdallarchaeota archaeon]
MIVDIVFWINIILGILVFIPSIVLMNYYRISNIQDFQLFSMFFIIASLGLIFGSLASFYGILIFYKLHWWAYNIGFLLLFIYTMRIHWSSPPILLRFSGYMWFGLNIILIGFWEEMIQPSRSRVLWFEMNRSFSSYYPSGAGIIVNGSIIYSSAYHILSDFLFIGVSLLLTYSHIKIVPVKKTSRVETARKIWIIASFLLAVAWILTLPLSGFMMFSKYIVMVSALMVLYINIKIPEAVLISQYQIARVIELYKVIKIEDNYPKYYSIRSLKRYIESVSNE